MDDFFDETYLSLASSEVRGTLTSTQTAFIARHFLTLKHSLNILDFCCGQGRHLSSMTKLGHQLTGIDNSRQLLSAAATELGDNAKLINEDVRSYKFDSCFDLILCMETSFNFNDIDAAKIMKTLSNALSVSGTILIHVFNPAYAMQNLPKRTWVDLDHSIVLEKRNYHGDILTINQQRLKKTLDGTYSSSNASINVHLRTLENLVTIASQAGLSLTKSYGSFSDKKFSPTEPEIICAFQHK